MVKLKLVHQDPRVKGSKPVLRSVNEREGLEFTVCLVIY